MYKGDKMNKKEDLELDKGMELAANDINKIESIWFKLEDDSPLIFAYLSVMVDKYVEIYGVEDLIKYVKGFEKEKGGLRLP